jgi:N-formylglutamate deformylase
MSPIDHTAEPAASMTPQALQRADTDWHLPQLYDFLHGMGVSTIAARYSRYVIDLNRPDTDTNLYPGQDTTGLCPLDTFFKAPLYQAGREPDQAGIALRLQRYWLPYHQQLRAELDRLLQIHPVVALWDAHSIASQVPRFFAGKLPDLNLGTADGKSCAPGMLDAVTRVVAGQQQFTLAVNGRFKGGHITRHYGQQAAATEGGAVKPGVHSIQLEMCQSVYMNESAPFAWRPDLAQQVQPLVRAMVQAVLDWTMAASAGSKA